MQVLWFSHLIPYPPKSGALLRAYNLLRALARRHSVDLLAFVQEPLLRSFYPSVEEGLRDCHANLDPICRSTAFLPIQKMGRPFGKPRTAAESLFARGGYMANWLYCPPAAEEFSRRFASCDYDLVHFDHESLALYRERCAGVPATLTHHNVESHMLLRRAKNTRNLVAKLYYWQEGHRLEHFERRISPEFAAHMTCSELDSERLRRIMPDASVRTIPNGVDVTYFVPQGAAQRPQSVVFVSSMNWYPNVDAVLFLLQEIWPRVSRNFPDAELDIVGANAPASVRQSAARYANVTLHGYVEDIRPIMDSAAIYVCPVRDGGGTKLKMLDALAMGKCIVAHPVACEGIAVTADENVVLATDAEEFARKIGELFQNAQRRHALGAAARTLAVDGYSFASIGADFTGLLESVADT